MINREVEKTLSNLGLQRPAQRDYIPAVLGVSFNSTKFVDVPNRAGYVYARIRGNLSEVVQVFNDAVVPAYGLQVLITRDDVVKSRYKVIARDFGAYPNGWGTTSPYLGVHAPSHSFNPDDPGGDIVWIYPQQFLPLLGYPGTTGVVNIHPYTYEYGGDWYYVGNTGTSTVLSYSPTGSANNKVVLVYLDYAGNPQLVAGNEFPGTYTGTVQITPYIPSLPDDGLFSITAVRLATGTTSVVWANLYDVRPFFDVPSITGTYIPASISTYPSVYDDATYKTTGTLFSFTEDLSVVVTGTSAYVGIPTGTFSRDGHVHPQYSTGSSISGGNVIIYDDGVFKATGTSISFNNNLTVEVTGTAIYVSSPITTYQRVAQPIPLSSVTGTNWVVPDRVYASGSLAVFQSGLILVPVIDFQEAVWVSGTYSLTNVYPTGTVFVTMYGVPCVPQAYIVTGTFILPINALLDSNGNPILDSNGNYILDNSEFLLMESGDYRLKEDGSYRLLE
jgi:hypothetical protein